METTSVSSNRQMNKEDVIYIHTYIQHIIEYCCCCYSAIKKEWNFAICNMDGLGGHYAKWNKSRHRKTNTVWHYLYADMLSHVQLFVMPWTVAHQAPLSMGFPMQEYWSGLPFPSPGDLIDQGPNLRLLRLLHRQVNSLPLVPAGGPI